LTNDDSFESMLEGSFAAAAGVAAGEKIEARVVSIGKDWVFLDLGFRAEGLLPREEALQGGELVLAEGDRVTVLTVGGKDGAVLCALRLGAAAGHGNRGANATEALASLRDAYDSGIPVEGTVQETNRGGLSVLLMGQRAFCPISQIEAAFCAAADVHVGRTYPFLITRFEESGRNIVVSRRRLLEREAEEVAKRVLETLAEGEVRHGTVKTLQKYGAFVDIGGVEGLIHVSELSHRRIEDPSEILEVGQQVAVQIKEIDRKQGRISLSLKSLTPDPWLQIAEGLSPGQAVRGKVTRIARFGAFVEIAPGVEGLVHISRLAVDRRVNTPREVVQEGQAIDVRVVEVDAATKRIALERIDENAEDERVATEDFRHATRPASGKMGTFADLLRKK
jgi:small subunit ribosomal protein S1